jgi:hypothetical protein
LRKYEIGYRAVELANKNSGNIEFLKRRLDSIKANKKTPGAVTRIFIIINLAMLKNNFK